MRDRAVLLLGLRQLLLGAERLVALCTKMLWLACDPVVMEIPTPLQPGCVLLRSIPADKRQNQEEVSFSSSNRASARRSAMRRTGILTACAAVPNVEMCGVVTMVLLELKSAVE